MPRLLTLLLLLLSLSPLPLLSSRFQAMVLRKDGWWSGISPMRRFSAGGRRMRRNATFVLPKDETTRRPKRREKKLCPGSINRARARSRRRYARIFPRPGAGGPSRMSYKGEHRGGGGERDEGVDKIGRSRGIIFVPSTATPVSTVNKLA